MLEIDGSIGEGGGQILRTALGLSTLTNKPFRIRNIRSGRCTPGLKNQHLYCIKALQQLSGSKAKGADPGSCEVEYHPASIRKSKLDFDVGTAGSITLILQSLMIPCIFGSQKTIRIKGGTDVRWSQPVDYLANVIIPQLRRFAQIDARILKRGYYPKGGGIFEIKISPKWQSMEGCDTRIELLERPELKTIRGISHSSKSLPDVAERQARSASMNLKDAHITQEYCETDSRGSGIALWAIFDSEMPVIIGADSLGEKGKRAEDVGHEAAIQLKKEIESGCPVGYHLADNLIPYLAIAGGSIKVSEISGHTRTNMKITEMFLGGRFDVEGNLIEYVRDQQA